MIHATVHSVTFDKHYIATCSPLTHLIRVWLVVVACVSNLLNIFTFYVEFNIQISTTLVWKILEHRQLTVFHDL